MNNHYLREEDRDRFTEHITWNVFPAGEPKPKATDVARLAVQMFNAGGAHDVIPGTAETAGQVCDNLRLHGFIAWCPWCEGVDPEMEYCRQCGGCAQCCGSALHTACCRLPVDVFESRQGVCLCGGGAPTWRDGDPGGKVYPSLEAYEQAQENPT